MAIAAKWLAGLGSVSLAAVVCLGQGEGGIKIQSVASAVTPPLSSHLQFESGWRPGTPPNIIHYPRKPGPGGGGGGGGGGSWSDPDLTSPQQGSLNYSDPSLSVFQGQSFTGAVPPDTNMAVGFNPDPNSNHATQIVQVVNTSYAVYDTSGNTLAGNDLGASLFANLPTSANCNANADGGDVVVLWDAIDHRWLISQLAYNSTFSQNDFCLAISDTWDATGTYHVYDISFGGSVPDYPKLGVWGDGIYFSANMFHIKVNQFTGATSSTFLGAQACSFPLSSVSSPPVTITFTCSGSGNTAIYNILPASLDGASPAGTTGSDYYLQCFTTLSSTSGNTLKLYQFTAGKLVSLANITVDTFHEACGGGTCVPQLGTTQQLDSLGDRLMYRLSYRKYSTTQCLSVNHSVQVGSATAQTGVRWYLLCSPVSTSSFVVSRRGTFSPDTTTYRWMGSMAQDANGNLGLGYSTSSSNSYPSIYVTGLRNGVDTTMENESLLYAGPNFQDTYNRWGDYSSMVVDPKDDCTFWYTTEYSSPGVLGLFNFFWGTVVGSFHFDNCAVNP